MFVEAYEVVGIVIPEQGIRGNEVYLSVAPVDALLGGRVIEVAEGDLFPFRDGGLDTVYADVDAFVDGFYAAVLSRKLLLAEFSEELKKLGF